MRGCVLFGSIRPPGGAQAIRLGDFADGGGRRRRILDHRRACICADEGALHRPAGAATRPEADTALVLAVGRVAPRRGICEGPTRTAEHPAEGRPPTDAAVGVAAAALLPSRTQGAFR